MARKFSILAGSKEICSEKISGFFIGNLVGPIIHCSPNLTKSYKECRMLSKGEMTLENIERLIQDTLKLFPEEIDISDGELRNDNGFFSQNLSKAWHRAEESTGTTGCDIDFMIWSVFGMLHNMSRENFAKGIYYVSLNDINYEELKLIYIKALREAE